VSAKWADLRKREAAAEAGLKEVADWRGSLRDEARRAAAEADDRADAIVSSSKLRLYILCLPNILTILASARLALLPTMETSAHGLISPSELETTLLVTPHVREL